MTLGFTRNQLTWFYAIGLGLFILSLFQAVSVCQPSKISFLDVGQGDAILIQTSELHQILVDAGPDISVVDELGKTMPYFDKTIDLFVLSHPDRDHFGGILDLMQKYSIKKILMSGISSDDSFYREFLTQTKILGIPINFAERDRDYQIGPNLYLDVLYPPQGNHLIGQIPNDKNNQSLVLRIVEKRGESIRPIILLTGDAEALEETRILAEGNDVRAEILKLGHHGSKYSTSDIFLKNVSPKTVVVSAGKDNRYGHPAPETLEKVRGLDIRRTDKEGDFSFVLD